MKNRKITGLHTRMMSSVRCFIGSRKGKRMIQDNEIIIRAIEEKDLPILWSLAFKEDAPEWKNGMLPTIRTKL